ncbi:protein DEHYDRATION-INDUCED 19 homolog 4-like isoform X1 [Cucurbita moschata]|uniref:Protein DEHYDRATION-INDUCED 19 homolog 4-like isoform X1 n=1 Tax=Cucurbita moschata TaxID=3662 RepID=A0A6J1H3I7_CUCMO|nr:protein DEHYDRATION-INDUCED 19 homolog 4-like isoform X1 [Cucurbita moschata]
MEADSWNAPFQLSSSRRYRSRSGVYQGDHEEIEEENSRTEFLCPFCAEDFDIVGLYCHVDEEHPVEVKNAVCPLCTKKVGMDIVGHIISQHGSLFKVQRQRRLRKIGSNLTFSKLRKELREGNLRSLLGGSLHSAPTSTEPDPLLFSFTSNLPTFRKPARVQSQSSAEVTTSQENPKAHSERSSVSRLAASNKDEKERAQKCEFVQGLLMSTILDEL